MQLRDHAFGQLADLAGAPDSRLGEKCFRLGAIEARMYTGDVVDGLRDAHPARQNGHVGDKADILHQAVARRPGIETEHTQCSLIWREAEDRVQGRSFTGSVRAYESDDAAFFDGEIDAIKRESGTE